MVKTNKKDVCSKSVKRRRKMTRKRVEKCRKEKGSKRSTRQKKGDLKENDDHEHFPMNHKDLFIELEDNRYSPSSFDQMTKKNKLFWLSKSGEIPFTITEEPKKKIKEYWLMFTKKNGLAHDKWVCIKKSDVAKSKTKKKEMGLFACRHFKKESMVGIYMGIKVDRNNVPENKDYVLGDIDAGKVEKRAFMGMHFINDPTFGFEKGTKEYEQQESLANVEFRTRGNVIAKKNIYIGDEILGVYNRDMEE